MWLNEKDKKYLNDVYANAYKKYFSWTAPTPNGTPLTYQEALVAARDELDIFYTVRRAEINSRHDARALAINTEANKRGLITSTVVLQQLDKALAERDIALSKFETVTDAKVRAAARKMMADELGAARLRVQADRGAHDMLLRRNQVGGLPQTDLQRAMDEEVFAEYLRFLLSQTPQNALAYVNTDPLFVYNLSQTYYDKLKAQMVLRGW